jgi:hypothetical protein
LSFAAGEVYWAVVPTTPRAPFQVHVKDKPPVEVPDAKTIVDGLRKGGDAELRFVVEGKARPVLLLSDQADERTGDLFGLRLMRLGSLSSPLGQLDQNEMRVLAERFVSYWQFDLHQLLVGKIRELLRRRDYSS